MKLKIKMIVNRRTKLSRMLKVVTIIGVIGIIIFFGKKRNKKDQ